MPRSLTRIFTARYWVPLALLAVPSLHLHLRAADESIGQLRAWAIARGTEESVLRRPASTVGIVSLEPGILASSRGDFYIEDASGGISVASSAALKFTQGNRVRVTGELWLSDTREPELIASRVEIISHLAPLAARTMTLAQFALPENQGRLVSFRSIVTSVSVGESRDTILVENGQMEGYYRRLLPHSNSFIARTLPGSDMRLTGILMPPARGHIRIRLRGGGDAELLQPPRLLSPNLLLGIAGVFAALVALGGIWVLLLRRSVARATIKIRTLLVKSEESSRL